MGTTTSRYRILHYVPNLGRGGAEKQLVLNIYHLNREHFECFVCYGGPPTDLKDTIETAGVRVACAGASKSLASFRPALAIRRLILKYGIDLVHVGLFPSRFAFIAAASTRTPVVTTIPSSFDPQARTHSERKSAMHALKWKSMIAVQVWLAKFCRSDFVAVSASARESAIRELGIPPDRITVIYRGLEPESFAGPLEPQEVARLGGELELRNASPILMNTGRLVPPKGHRDLLHAMPAILQQFPKAKLLIAGDGPLLPELRQLRRELGLDASVLLLGNRRDVRELLYLSDVFLFTSFYEGIPNAVIEASASGKPVVAFDIPAVREVVEDGGSGVLVRPRDAQDFARTVVELLTHPDRAKQMGLRGQQIVKERFDIRKNVRQLEALYENILGGPKGAQACAVSSSPRHGAR